NSPEKERRSSPLTFPVGRPNLSSFASEAYPHKDMRPEYIAVAISGAALLVSFVALHYTRRSANAARDSAATARQALEFEQRRHASTETQQREATFSRLAQEAVEGWKLHGDAAHIFDREASLSPEDQETLARRIWRARGQPEADALRWLEQWRASR